MITLINNTVAELGELSTGANSATLQKINRIKKAIQSQDPDDILLILQKSGDLSPYFGYWNERSSQDPEKIKETFQNTDRPVVQILIDQHILKSIIDPGKSKIVWINPNIVNPQKRKVIPQSIENKKPDYNSQSKTAIILGVSRQAVQKLCKGKFFPAVGTEGRDKGKVNLWHPIVQQHKAEIESKKNPDTGPAPGKPVNKTPKKSTEANGHNNTEVTFEEIENLTIKEVVERYGGISGFKTYVEALEKISSWKGKEQKYLERRKQLVSINPVARSLYSLVDSGFRRVLEYPTTVTDQLTAIALSKKKTSRIDMIALQEEMLSRILKGVKKEVLKGLDDVGGD